MRTAKTSKIARIGPADANESLPALISAIHACRVCRDQPRHGAPLAHEPRPVLQVSPTARICIAGQAPGIRVHGSGRPFTDPSGVRLRQWLGMDESAFYDSSKVAILPMGFCFPGLRPDGSDLPPRRECADIWRKRLFARLPNVALLLLVGGYAQQWHLGSAVGRQGVDETVRQWRRMYETDSLPRMVPLPHPSWRNSGWLKRNPWFEDDMLPLLRAAIRDLLR
jgi:uracil-DNA glycosylase